MWWHTGGTAVGGTWLCQRPDGLPGFPGQAAMGDEPEELHDQLGTPALGRSRDGDDATGLPLPPAVPAPSKGCAEQGTKACRSEWPMPVPPGAP